MSRKGPRISDTASFKKLREDAQGVKLLTRARPLLRLFGVEIGDDLVAKTEELAQAAAELTSLPDRFNDLFAERGWIAYDMLNSELMRTAVEMGEAGDIDGAEELLVEHFDEETIDWGIKFMWAVEPFRRRERLARLALTDYLESRYHACVPVVLMILDGIVNDVEQGRGFTRGFFAEGADLTAWDSIAAHSRGLQNLKEIMTRSRKKTTTEPIALPYRHGILHGRDLAYDSKLVAAKCWAALFALREWALAVRDRKLEEPPPKPEKGFVETLRDYADIQAVKARLAEWKARDADVLESIPRSGPPEEFEEGSPERTLAELADYWQRENYGHLTRLLYLPGDDRPVGPKAQETREWLEDITLVGYRIVDIQDTAPAHSTYQIEVDYAEGEEQLTESMELRLLYLDDEGTPLLRGQDGGRWLVAGLRLGVSRLQRLVFRHEGEDEEPT